MNKKIQLPSIFLIFFLYPLAYIFFVEDISTLLIFSLFYFFGILFSESNKKILFLFYTIIGLCILNLLFYIFDGNINIISTLKWFISIQGTLFFYFNFGVIGLVKMMSKFKISEDILLSIWSGIRAFEVTLSTQKKIGIIVNSRGITFNKNPIKYFMYYIIGLIRNINILIEEMDLTVSQYNYEKLFKFNKYDNKFNLTGKIFLIVIIFIEIYSIKIL